MTAPKKKAFSNIISIIHYQLSQIEQLLREDLEEKQITFNYLICEDELSFLSKNELSSYLTKTRVKNKLFLKGINKKCYAIIEIWNEDFKDLPDRKFDFSFANNETGKYFSTKLDFRAIFLSSDNKWQHFNTRQGKQNFVKEFNFSTYSIQNIAERCKLILNWITASYPETTPKELNVNKNTKQKLELNETDSKPNYFNELFYNSELIKPCIDILKELDPPQIDTENNYIGKLKGIICIWIDELQRQGITKAYSDRKIFASLIPQKIKRFSIDESMFAKHHKKAEINYRTDIKTKVSKIKLSQNSQ